MSPKLKSNDIFLPLYPYIYDFLTETNALTRLSYEIQAFKLNLTL